MNEIIFEKYKTQIKKVFELDDKAVDILSFEAGRTEGLTLLGKYPLIFHGVLAVITNILYPINRLKRDVKIDGDEDFIFVSCSDTIFRTKTIGLIADGLKYHIIYLPNFHIKTAINYHLFFEARGISVFFPTIKVSQVLKAWKKVNKLKSILGDNDKSVNRNKMISVLSSYAIYEQVVNTYLKQTESFVGKWILEHDKFYFNASVIKLHQANKICTMLQHGVFFKPSFNYIPLFCDKVLCCSEREKKIYMANSVIENRVIVFGAPLQTLQLEENATDKTEKYDLLIMLTIVKDENLEIIKDVLRHVKQNYNSVLVRLRPRSRKNDELLLAQELQGMTLNMEGSSIMEDLFQCKKVISFSEDANVEIAKTNKPFVYIWSGNGDRIMGLENCATIDNYADEIQKLMTQDFYSTFCKEKYNDILGETDVDVLKQRFYKYIKN